MAEVIERLKTYLQTLPKIKKGKTKNNPAVNPQGIYYFGEAAISLTEVSKAVRHLLIKNKC